MQEKEIIVTNLTSKTISPKAGQTWKAFTVFQIQGNDGITYETTQRDFYQTLTIGKNVKIKFTTQTKTSNGKVYTSYKIDLPKKVDPGVAELEKKLMERLDLMEKNIISAFKIIKTKVVEEPTQPSLFPDEEDDRTNHIDEDEAPDENPELDY